MRRQDGKLMNHEGRIRVEERKRIELERCKRSTAARGRGEGERCVEQRRRRLEDRDTKTREDAGKNKRGGKRWEEGKRGERQDLFV